MRTLHQAALAAAVLLAGTAAAQAGTYSVTVSEGITSGFSFQTANGTPTWNGSAPSSSNNYTGGIASAAFTYTGALNFVDTAGQNTTTAGDLNSVFGFSTSNVSGYGGSGTVSLNATPATLGNVANYNTEAGFLASSGSIAGEAYGSYYTFDLGTLAAGTVLTVTHDDGISLFEGGAQIDAGSTTDGPTVAVTNTAIIGTGGDVILRYSRQNGTPSVLQVSVPEPASLALLGAALIGLGAIRRRRTTRA